MINTNRETKYFVTFPPHTYYLYNPPSTLLLELRKADFSFWFEYFSVLPPILVANTDNPGQHFKRKILLDPGPKSMVWIPRVARCWWLSNVANTTWLLFCSLQWKPSLYFKQHSMQMRDSIQPDLHTWALNPQNHEFNLMRMLPQTSNCIKRCISINPSRPGFLIINSWRKRIVFTVCIHSACTERDSFSDFNKS